MDNTDWIFDALYDLSEEADRAGMRRLSKLLDLCMDVHIEEEKLLHEAGMRFRSSRAIAARNRRVVWPFRTKTPVGKDGRPLRPMPPGWLEALEARIDATTKQANYIPPLAEKV